MMVIRGELRAPVEGMDQEVTGREVDQAGSSAAAPGVFAFFQLQFYP